MFGLSGLYRSAARVTGLPLQLTIRTRALRPVHRLAYAQSPLTTHHHASVRERLRQSLDDQKVADERV